MAHTNTKTVIGVVPSFDEGVMIKGGDTDRIYLRRDYLQAIAGSGAVPLILHPEMEIEDIMPLCDGVVISGGMDIDPKFYGHNPEEALGICGVTSR